MSKMTDKEIIKALECCISAESCCVCGYTKMCDGTTIHQFALDLINRQQETIERLKEELLDSNIEIAELYKCKFSADDVAYNIIRTRAETIKELEAKIHEKLHEAEMRGNFEPVVTREMFDSVVKEMEGEGR